MIITRTDLRAVFYQPEDLKDLKYVFRNFPVGNKTVQEISNDNS